MPSRSHRSPRAVVRTADRRPTAPAATSAATSARALRASVAVSLLAAAAGQQQAAQVVMQQLDVAPGEPDKAKENTEPVYVRDSAVAQEKLALALRMERLKQWNNSADVYQEVLEKYHDRVVPLPPDPDG